MINKYKDVKSLFWTNHSQAKMRFYKLSEQRVKRVIHLPKRIEEGIAPNTVAMIQSAGSKKHPYEIWVMYQTKKQPRQPKAFEKPKLTIISAWRYPGKSPAKNPIPQEILDEIKGLL